MDTIATGTLRTLSAEDSAEVKKLKAQFDCSNTETLEKCIRQYRVDTEHFSNQISAIVRSAIEDGQLDHASSMAECLLWGLKLRALAAFEVGAQVNPSLPKSGAELVQLGMDITNEREGYKSLRLSCKTA